MDIRCCDVDDGAENGFVVEEDVDGFGGGDGT